jgi:hypothetical protein
MTPDASALNRSAQMLLVSFPNSARTVGQLAEAGLSLLGLIDLSTDRLTWLRLPNLMEPSVHATGLAQDDSFVFCVGPSGPHTVVAVYRKPDLELHSSSLLTVLSGHDVLCIEDYLYVVATGQDSVFRFKVDGGTVEEQGELVWRAPGSDGSGDTHHVNSLALVNSSLVVSAFGPKAGKTWSTARAGYLWDITRSRPVQERVYHPHSVFADDGGILYCESARGAVRQVGGGVVLVPSAYVRGISRLGDGRLAAGVSAGRQVSKSTGVINNPADPGVRTQFCGVLTLAAGWPAGPTTNNGPNTWLDMAPFHNEIYDILSVTGVMSPVQESILGQSKLTPIQPPVAIQIVDDLPDAEAEELRVQIETERLHREPP